MSNVRRATTGGRRAAFVIVPALHWRRAEGKFALIVLALWLLHCHRFPVLDPAIAVGHWMATMYGPSRPPSTGSALTAPARTCSAGCWPAHIPIL